MTRSNVFYGSFIFYSVVVPLALSIASIVIGSQYMNTVCDRTVPSWFMPLSTWLIVYGSVNLPCVLTNVLIVYLFIVEHDNAGKIYKNYQLVGLFAFA